MVDSEGGICTQAFWLLSRAFEAPLSPKPSMMQGTKSTLSKGSICEQITVPETQLAGGMAPGMRTSALGPGTDGWAQAF